MIRLKVTFLILLFLLQSVIATSSEQEHEKSDMSHSDLKVFKIDETGPDIKVPTKVLSEIFENEKSTQQINFMDIRVRFAEKTKGVLIEPEFWVQLPRGGGAIDLSKYVTDKNGTFRIYFETSALSVAKNAKAFFVSKARKRKLDGEVWGAGCKKILDMTSFFLSKAATEGIEVNTTRSRHLSVLMGYFILAADGQLAQITFMDSQQESLFCSLDRK